MSARRTRASDDLYQSAGSLKYYVTLMQVRHIPAVSAIERESFPVSWPPSAYRREIQRNQMAYYIVALRSALAGELRRNPRFSSEPQARSNGGSILGRLGRLIRSEDHRYEPQAAHELEHIVGYAGMWLMVDEAHVTTIAVDPAYRGEGIGELLLLALLDHAWEIGADTATLECRMSNTVAQQLYRKYRFEDVGVRKNYYSDDGEDALIMTTVGLESPIFRRTLAVNREKLLDRLRGG